MPPFIAAYSGVSKEGVSHLEADDLPDTGIRISTGKPAVAARKRLPARRASAPPIRRTVQEVWSY
jgi:hypothetical protein